jgi:hypothetical protein
MPSWLSFDSQSLAFYGTPTLAGLLTARNVADGPLGGMVAKGVTVGAYHNRTSLANRCRADIYCTTHVGAAHQWSIPGDNVVGPDGDLITHSILLQPNSTRLLDWPKFV